MSIRSVINGKPVVALVSVAVLVGVAVWLGVGSALPPQQIPQLKDEQAYFTADDGKTWFTDKVTTVTPYTNKDGKEVVRAYVFSCKDGKPFVAYLTKQNPRAPRDMTAIAQQAGGSAQPRPYGDAATEYKRPGEGSWEMRGTMSAASQQKIRPTCADGSEPEGVYP